MTRKMDWRVDGVDQSFEMFFHLRFGTAGSVLGAEDGLPDVLPLLSTDETGNIITLGYGDGMLAVDLVYTVFGGAAGSGNSTVQTNITLTNQSAGALDVVWFSQADLDLNWTFESETAVFTAPGTVVQTDGDGVTTATFMSSLAPTAWGLGTQRF